jgi:hypothetical protein
MITKKRLIIALAVSLLGIGMVAVAVTAVEGIPNSDGFIEACYDHKGNLRLAQNTNPCTTRETALVWRQSGIQGPVGPAGPQGEPGVAGPPRTRRLRQCSTRQRDLA